MSHYPRWVHHKELKGMLVSSKAEQEALGDGWGEDSAVWREVPEEKAEEIAKEEIPEASGVVAEEPKQKGKKARK